MTDDQSRLFEVTPEGSLETVTLSVTRDTLGYWRMTVYEHHRVDGELMCGSTPYSQLVAGEVTDVMWAALVKLGFEVEEA